MTQSFLANLPWVLLAALGSFAVYKIGDGKAEAIGRLEAASAKLAAMEAEAERTRQLHQELAAAKLVEQQLAARAQEAETRLATAAKEAETRTAAESDEEQLRTAVAVQVALQLASQQPEAPASDVAAPPEAPPEASCEGNGTLPRGLPHMLSGIAKWELQAGKPGTQSPRGADEVSLDFECTQEEAPLHAGTEVPHRMGDLEDAALLPGLDAALRSMLPGERAFFSLAPTDALGARVEALGGAPQATVHCAVALLSLTQIEDVSAMADRSVLKTQLAAGRGVETPKDGAQVVVRAAAYAPNGSYLNGTTNGSEWRMALGDGRCSEGLRLGLMSMRRAESARLNISAHMARDPTLGLAADEAVVVEVELLAFSQARALDQMSEAELAEHVGQRGERGRLPWLRTAPHPPLWTTIWRLGGRPRTPERRLSSHPRWRLPSLNHPPGGRDQRGGQQDARRGRARRGVRRVRARVAPAARVPHRARQRRRGGNQQRARGGAPAQLGGVRAERRAARRGAGARGRSAGALFQLDQGALPQGPGFAGAGPARRGGGRLHRRPRDRPTQPPGARGADGACRGLYSCRGNCRSGVLRHVS